MSNDEATGWRCGECDTWNTGDAAACLVCEEPVRSEWLLKPDPASSPARSGGPVGSGALSPPDTNGNPDGRPTRVSVPLHPQGEHASPAPTPGLSTPPSVPFLIASTSTSGRGRRSPLALLVIVAAIAFILVLAVLAFTTLT